MAMLAGIGREHVRALDPTADPAFGDDIEDARIGQHGHVAIEGRVRDVRQSIGQLGGGQPLRTEGQHDAQADRVQQELAR